MDCITKGPPSRPSNEFTCSRMTDPWWEVCKLCWTRNESSRPPIADIAKNITTIVCAMFSAYVPFMSEYLESTKSRLRSSGILRDRSYSVYVFFYVFFHVHRPPLYVDASSLDIYSLGIQ